MDIDSIIFMAKVFMWLYGIRAALCFLAALTGNEVETKYTSLRFGFTSLISTGIAAYLYSILY